METEKSLRKPSHDQRKFLSRWLNLTSDTDTLDAFWAAYKAWFRHDAFRYIGLWEAGAHEGWGSGPATPDSLKEGRNKGLLGMRDDMRGAWETPDLNARQWKLQPLRFKFNRLSAASESDLEEPPPPTAADDALDFLCSIASKLKLCDNKDCTVERYLIGVKKMPHFCESCLRIFRAKFKANWWKERKEGVNARRKRDYRRKKRGKVRRYRRLSSS